MSSSLYCAHCGLPIAGADATEASFAAPVAEYCCFGCQIAADMARETGADGELGRTSVRLGLSIFLSLNVMIFTMWLWTQDIYTLDRATEAATATLLWSLCRYACLVLSLPVLWMLGQPVAMGAWQSLRRGAPTTDLLLIAGTVAAYAYSVVSTLRGDGPVYFEIGCAVLVLVTVGRLLEARGKQQALAALEGLEKLLPPTVHAYVKGQVKDVPIDAVVNGDRLIIHAGERIPADGRVVQGLASIDASILTGESRSVICEPGDSVLGGTLNLDGDLTIEVEALPHEGTWQRLLDCMRDARRLKGRHQQMADLVARWFIPGVAGVAVATFAYHAYTSAFDDGMLAALAVVLVACPCALGLATPLAVWAALGSAAHAQVLFRHGEALERLADVGVVAFDKTGTLTDGCAVVDQFIVDGESVRQQVLARTLSVTATSAHDLSRALFEFTRKRFIGTAPPCEVRTLPGRGLVAHFADISTPVMIGNQRLMRESQLRFSTSAQQAMAKFSSAGIPLVCIGWAGEVRAVCSFREQLRDTVVPSIAECHSLGLIMTVLTGDHAARGESLANTLHVPVLAELLPEDKFSAIVELRRQHGPVVMVGDGLNDAPALTAASVGMALGCGADVSRQSADVCLLGNDLCRVPWAIKLSRQTVRVIRQNLLWTFFYNTIGIGLAAVGWLNPIWAAAAMAVGSLGVVGNSLRLAHFPQPTDSHPSGDTPSASPTSGVDLLDEAIP